MSTARLQKSQLTVTAQTPHRDGDTVTLVLRTDAGREPGDLPPVVARIECDEDSALAELVEPGEEYVLELRRGTLDDEHRRTMADDTPNTVNVTNVAPPDGDFSDKSADPREDFGAFEMLAHDVLNELDDVHVEPGSESERILEALQYKAAHLGATSDKLDDEQQ